MSLDRIREMVRRNVVAFVQFAGLSGVGWLTDFALLQLLVLAFALPVTVANIFSSLAASLMVFHFSRRRIFRAAEGRAALRTAAFAAYTLVVILLASALAGYVHALLAGAVGAWGLHVPQILLVAATKVAITPPQLILNYLVSKHIAEFGGKARDIV